MARKRKPKILYVEAPDEEAQDTHAVAPEEQSRRRKRKVENRRPAPKVIKVEENPSPVPPPEEVSPEAEAENPPAAEASPEAKPESRIPAKDARPTAKVISTSRLQAPQPEPPRTPEPAPPQEAVLAAVSPPPPPGRRPNLVLSLLFGGVFLSVLAAFIFIPLDKNAPVEASTEELLPNCLGIHPGVDWGYDLHTLECRGGIAVEGENLADILLNRQVSYKAVIRLVDGINQQSLPGLQPGNSYTLLYHPEDPLHPYLLAYAPDATSYILLNLRGESQVEYYKLGVDTRDTRQMEVAVISNLAEAMFNREFGLDLARKMEAVLKWKLDLFHLEPGDRFSLLYDEVTYEGGARDIVRLSAVRYRHQGEEGYAFHFQDAYVNGYYDMEGRPMRSGYLQAPLEYGRISSSYNLKRRDPLSHTGEIRAHLGTDYAAPTGTPILAVADGIVLKAERKGGNGNYVKLFHSKQIQTQYLHMRNFAEGIAPGVEVRQGEVIGYVGSTGRATGPHVCFRFWKDGEQVDHRKEKFLGPAPALRGTSLEAFQQRRDSLMRFFEPV